MPLNVSQDQVAFNERGKGSFKLPFKEQIDYFNQKNPLPTEHWDDVIKEGHDKAFVVSGAAKADLINDLHSAVKKGIENGKSIGWFRDNFDKIVEKHGWEASGPYAWRTRMIYATNVRSSYAAGRWKQLNDPDLLLLRPYWKYLHNDNVSQPRPMHQSWHGKVLRHDDPWWQSHYPPKGFGCRCYVVAVKASEFKGEPALDDGTYEKTDRYGVTHTLPVGVDYGWDYVPGDKASSALREIVQEKLIRYPLAITRALTKDVNRYIDAHTDIVKFVNSGLENKALNELLWLGFVEDAAKIEAVSSIDVKGYLVLLPSDAINHIEKHHGHDGKDQRPTVPNDYTYLQDILTGGDIYNGQESTLGFKRIVVAKVINGELFRAVFEIRTGKKAKYLLLVTLNIKTAKNR